MDEAKKEARRKLLAEIAASEGAKAIEPAKIPPPSERVAFADLDAAAERLVPAFEAPLAAPAVDDLDAGWEDDEADEEEEIEEPEPELPDERLDPVAYAEAKAARDERVKARRERKRIKGEAKKARRKARAEAAKGKQKSKGKRARPPAKSSPERDATADAPTPARTAATASKPPPAEKPRMLSRTNTWMLALAIVVFIAAAIFAGVVAR